VIKEQESHAGQQIQVKGAEAGLVLVHRLALFLVWQALIAVCYLMAGHSAPWAASAAWWPVSATLTNFITIAYLRRQAAREGVSYRQLIGAVLNKQHVKLDLLTVLGVLLAAAPAAMLPNIGLAQLLFGDPMAPVAMFAQPLPVGVALMAMVLFPLTIAFAELPFYFGYVMPRLAAGRPGYGWPVILPAIVLAAQHVTLPLIPDPRFILWRLGMFVPFALLLGFVLRWRPRLLPYLMAVHALIDLSAASMVWQVSTGG
jgi:hypothetical protein